MIKTLSPYYINIPFVSPLTGATALSYTLNIFIWNGLKFEKPSTATYQITKANPTASTDLDKINIARLINDFIEFNPTKSTTTELVNGNNQIWVATEVTYITDNEDDNDVLQLIEVNLALKGYGYGLSGENPQHPTNKILIPIEDYKVNRNGFFNVPILIDETVDTSEIVLTNVEATTPEGSFTYTFTIDFTPDELIFQATGIDSPIWVSQIISSDITSPQDVLINRTSFQTRIKAYNPATGNVIFSNVIEVTP
jgi:hypothetical protein